MAEKITKRDILAAIKAIAEQDPEGKFDDKVSAADVIEYVDTTIAQIDHKNEQAKKRAEKKKAEGDSLRDQIESVLTEEYKTIKTIIAEIGDEDLTPGKVSARVGQLIKLDKAHRTKIKEGDRQVTAYAVGPAPATDEDTE